MKLNAPIGFFEVYKYFVKYGQGIMLCYYDGNVMHYVQFSSGYRRIIINKEIFESYKKEMFSTTSEQGA